MGKFRFYRRVNIFPGLSVYLSKSGPSLTVGVRGAHMTFGRKGITRTVGLPGTGIYYTSRSGYHSGVHSAHTETPIDPQRQATADRAVGLGMLAIAVLIVLAIAAAIDATGPHG